jgi:hypothetical protein
VEVLAVIAAIAALGQAYFNFVLAKRLGVRSVGIYAERFRTGWVVSGLLMLLVTLLAIVAAVLGSLPLLKVALLIYILGFLAPWAHRKFSKADPGRSL